ncbi:ATP-binding protein [Rhodococcus sp. SGAir0479]|uniref:ATP-binding protein n=1 Tax=Rhodococcus sp. SGAir0479 TaxID=2567884 RepID=UPI0010CD532C|nr:ATP-binding protein [Rhodococcus sp. SGAir0479]QCQ93520.1 ATP-binding protein [Rhodococcus sp. SGAir0479]
MSVSSVPACGSALPTARRTLVKFAQEQGVPDEIVSDMSLASYEAMANIVEHAYPARSDGTFDVQAQFDDSRRELTVVLTDHGRWKNAPASAGSFRGRGLALIRACSHTADIATGPEGTRVSLRWNCNDR